MVWKTFSLLRVKIVMHSEKQNIGPLFVVSIIISSPKIFGCVLNKTIVWHKSALISVGNGGFKRLRPVGCGIGQQRGRVSHKKFGGNIATGERKEFLGEVYSREYPVYPERACGRPNIHSAPYPPPRTCCLLRELRALAHDVCRY